MKKNFTVLDIGNSRLKILINDNYYSFFHKDNSIQKAIELFNKHKDEIELTGFSSVNKSVEKELIDFFKIEKLSFISSEELIENQDIIDCSGISGMGHDRIFGLAGALEYLSPPLITIDCGTAITINVLDGNNKVLGGVIFPGHYTQLKALAENASALFETNLKINESILADNTKDAINNGILFSIAGGITKIVESIISDYKIPKQNILITGGAVELILPALKFFKFTAETKDRLVLQGIKKILSLYS